ncbi:MAG TPA: hypothetical protein VF070_48825 [Streptosporangiaceae bacterium]
MTLKAPTAHRENGQFLIPDVGCVDNIGQLHPDRDEVAEQAGFVIAAEPWRA